MKTIRLYDESPYTKTCESVVLSFDGLEYIFDRSIFFPEKGGQKSDRGFIGGVEVLQVQEVQGQLIHYLKSPLNQDRVTMVLDFEFRRDQMQQHCGEHILSGLIKSLFGGNNKGFHISSDFVTLDVNIPLSEAMILELEHKSNQVIYDNKPIRLSTLETFDENQLRKPPTVAFDDLNEVRVVSILGVDAVTCCGTHPERTGEVGLIKLYKVEKHRGNYRIYFKCGQRALKDFQLKASILQDIHLMYNTNDENILNRLSQKEDNNESLKSDYNRLNLLYAKEVARYQWDENALTQFISFEYLNKNVFNDWLKSVTLKDLKFVCIYIASLKQVVLCHDGSSDFSCIESIKEAEDFSGKGGGTDKRAQVKFDTKENGLKFFSFLKKNIKQTK